MKAMTIAEVEYTAYRLPQVRWEGKEPENPVDMSDDEIVKRFMVLTRQNNLWKSRFCERCFKTGQRGTFPGIDFFYKGSQFWDKKISPYDSRGCEGCFWYDPYEWRKALNLIIKENIN